MPNNTGLCTRRLSKHTHRSLSPRRRRLEAAHLRARKHSHIRGPWDPVPYQCCLQRNETDREQKHKKSEKNALVPRWGNTGHHSCAATLLRRGVVRRTTAGFQVTLQTSWNLAQQLHYTSTPASSKSLICSSLIPRMFFSTCSVSAPRQGAGRWM